MLHIHNIAEKENINVVYLKTEPKPFTQNAYLLPFLETSIIVALVSHTRAQAMYNSCKLNLKKQ